MSSLIMFYFMTEISERSAIIPALLLVFCRLERFLTGLANTVYVIMIKCYFFFVGSFHSPGGIFSRALSKINN